ncbi:MAG TPA: Ppx/GppA phosphatase family protein [Candidatus Thermoplasmatota archaeon]
MTGRRCGAPRRRRPPEGAAGRLGRVVAFMDIGTNSVRLLVVRVRPNHSFLVLNRQKEVVRLGEGAFTDRELREGAMDRAVLVIRRFAELAISLGADEIQAVATSATREARNRGEFLRRVRRDAGVTVRTISGREEARLIYLGVSSAIHMGRSRGLFIDIGGGSTELILADQQRAGTLESMRVGAIRLTNQYLEGDPGAVDDEEYARMVRHVEQVGAIPLKRLARRRVDFAVGSSGTIENLAEVASRKFRGRRRERGDTLAREELASVRRMLCHLPLEQRRKVKGINPDRADIIIAGAAILEVIMDEVGIDEVRVSDRGLHDGMLVDYLARRGNAPALTKLSARERSVLQLGRACNFDERHARVVTRLALDLFDTAKEHGLHGYGAAEREILQFAGLLHDIGVFLSYENHHEHTWYLVRNADLIGFAQEEIDFLAALAYFHRGSGAAKENPRLEGLDKRQREAVGRLSVLLRLAESLDRSRGGVVRSARFHERGGKLVINIRATKDCHLERWSVENHRKAFRKAFGRKLLVRVTVDTGAGGRRKTRLRRGRRALTARRARGSARARRRPSRPIRAGRGAARSPRASR